MKQVLYVVSGQTAVGKTGTALALAKKMKGELVSADARQCYRHLDVISGKERDSDKHIPVEREGDYCIGYSLLEGIPVWLYDMADPHEQISAYDWACCAKRAMRHIFDSGKVPILVGGSWFYLKTLLWGLSESAPPQNVLRESLGACTLEELQEKVLSLSPGSKKALNNSDWNNPRRLMRIIEKKSATVTNIEGIYHSYDVRGTIIFFKDIEDMKRAIVSRVAARVKAGAFEEVEELLRMKYSATDPGMHTIGYQELLGYYEDNYKKDEAIERWIAKECQYAKRQKTFMKKDTYFLHINQTKPPFDMLAPVLY